MTEGKLPPGPESRTRFGNVLSLVRDWQGFAERVSRKYGDVASYRNLVKRVHLLSHPNHAKRVLAVDDDKFKKKLTYTPDRQDPIFREGVVATDGEKWQRQRRMIGDGFRSDTVRGYTSQMSAQTGQMMNEWEVSDSVSITQLSSELTIRFIGTTLFDADPETDLEGLEEPILELESGFPLWVKLVVRFAPWVPVPHTQREEENIETLDDIVYDFIKRRRDDGADGEDVLSSLIRAEENGTIDEDEIRDQIVTFFYGGHGNMAMTLAYTLVQLATRPEVQKRARKEIETVIGGDDVRESHLDQLTYVESVLKETLRLYPPAMMIRRLTTCDVQFDDWVIPEGSEVMVAIWLFQRDERFWDEPETFRPERWMEDRSEYAYYPFGSGLRRCIAEEFSMNAGKILVSRILGEYRLSPDFDETNLSPKADIPGDPPYEVTLHEW